MFKSDFSVFRGSLSERGFTLIELLYVVAIMGILSSIMWGFFALYKENAEYTKAQTTLRNARTAMEVGDEEAGDGFVVPLTVSASDGGPVVGAMQTILPGATTSPDVQLSVMYRSCDGAVGMQLTQLIISQPCNATRYLTYQRFCNGLEIEQGNVAQPKGIC